MELVEQIVRSLAAPPGLNPPRDPRNDWVGALGPDEILQLVARLAEMGDRLGEPVFAKKLENLLPRLMARGLSALENFDPLIAGLGELYRATPAESNLRNLWLAWLGRMGTESALTQWADLAAADPPQYRAGIGAAYAPLIHRRDLPDSFFHRLLGDCLAHPHLAACSLDLINHQFREGMLAVHPARARCAVLGQLLGQLVDQLERVEEIPLSPETDVAEMQRHIADAIPLVVSLCDALALAECREGEGKLRRASQLRHRRIQTEAAAALARLEIADGCELLAQLAAEPIARQRVLAYAEELGLMENIPEEHRSEIAIAESRLANWLAEPNQMGLPPTRIEFLEHRELFWPSYEHPVHCFLFQYTYSGSRGEFKNIGLVGPLVHAFDIDLSWLSRDDLFAAFAGWQAVHDDIYEVSLEELEHQAPGLLRERLELLDDGDYAEVQPLFAGKFLQEWLVVCEARLENQPGFAMVGEDGVNWFGNDPQFPLDADFAYTIYRGRRMLQAFNSDPY